MSIDLSQFYQVFFEESFEGLDIMESNLLALNIAEVDSETINTIFRAAHSIKGGAGTFGFMQISGFTHVLETLLDEIRSGERDIEQEHIDMLLQCVDCLRGLMSDLQAGNEPDMAQADELKIHFEKVLANNSKHSTESEDTSGLCADDKSTSEQRRVGWIVHFIPCEDVLCTGNEPYRMFRELKDLAEAVGGSFEVECHRQSLPKFSEMHPEMCYLSWTIHVRADVELSDIEEIFEWVVDDCDIRYEPLSDNESKNASDATVEAVSEPLVPEGEISYSLHNNDAVNSDLKVSDAAEDNLKIDSLETDSREIDCNEVKAKTNASAKVTKKSTETTSIRVSIDKIDGLINMVGELVITQSMLGQLGQEFDMGRIQRLQEGLAQLEQNTRELQESVMKIRMLPISFAFSRFPRLVRDLSK